jgi:hypothetical protein
MEVIVIELFLWAGLIFFFWALKDGLSHVEADIDDLGIFNNKPVTPTLKSVRFVLPERVLDLIGRYQDAPIYQFAVIGGRYYRFDRVCPGGTPMATEDDERFVSPGLVYVPLPEREIPAL